MRQHARRKTEIPVRYYGYGMPENKTGQLRDVSLSGLSFKSHYHFQSGTRIIVHIPYTSPLFKTFASVIWCHHSDSFYEVGIKFHDINGDTQKVMFEQICLIENYRTDVRKTECRTITSEQAAREWLSLLGNDIPC
jgi:hypothetical protein